eukprot:1490757-Lingulodinium_polyedra.AAC.1
MVIACWCVGQAGIAERFRDDNPDGPELARQMNANFHACRQTPFAAWRRCRAACAPDLRFPGQRAAPRRAE